MTIDLNQSQDVLRLKEDIDGLVRLDRVQDWQRRFSRWQISARKPGGYYEVQDLAGSGGAPDRGYYLTNLVLQGGGTLGLAHAGFIAGLEQGNFRFPGVAGTSAGAIVAMGMLVMRKQDISNGVADKVRDLVDQIPMDMFVDGPRVIRRLVKRLAARRSIRRPLFWPALFESFARLKNKRGLNSGEVFERWMKNILAEYGIMETADLELLMDGIAKDLSASKIGDQKPFQRQNRPIEKNDVFKIISTAMPTGSKFCLPRDLKYLDPEYRELSPAKLVRMSMSIPLFFEPVVLKPNRRMWQGYVADNIEKFVSDRAALEMAELSELYFLDGGLFSNLPTDELIDGMSENLASISVPLVSTDTTVTIQNRKSPRALISDTAAVLNAVRLQRDRDAHERIARRPQADTAGNDFPRHIVTKIDTGRAHWLNFTMSDTEKEELYIAGLLRARELFRKGA